MAGNPYQQNGYNGQPYQQGGQPYQQGGQPYQQGGQQYQQGGQPYQQGGQQYQYSGQQYQQGYTQPGQPSQQWLSNDAFASGPSGKSRGIFALLAIFLGCFGIQYFYIGKIPAGLIWLFGYWFIFWFLFLITIWLGGIGCLMVGFFPLIQGIIVFCANNQDFERKFASSTSFMPLL